MMVRGSSSGERCHLTWKSRKEFWVGSCQALGVLILQIPESRWLLTKFRHVSYVSRNLLGTLAIHQRHCSRGQGLTALCNQNNFKWLDALCFN